MHDPGRWTTRALVAFWLPLALSWTMMIVAQPITAIAISRLPDPEIQLAAYGVTFDLGFLLESPIIMLLSASVALTRDRAAYRLLRSATLWASAALTALFAVVAFTPLYDALVGRVIGVPGDVAAAARPALGLLLPWIPAIAWRRFHQGPLITGDLTRLISVGTLLRLLTVSLILLAGVLWPVLPGAMLGALALSVSVTVEALVITAWALPVVRRLPQPAAAPLTLPALIRFCTPLAATDVMRTVVRPVITGGVSRAVLPQLSLAAWPVANGVIQMLSGALMAFQDMTVAVIDNQVTYGRVRRFVLAAGAAVVAAAVGLAFTPLIDFFLFRVIGLPAALGPHVVTGVRLMLPLPFLYAVRNLLRGVLIRQRSTASIQIAMTAYMGALVLAVLLGVRAHLGGVTVAALAVVAAQIAEIAVPYVFFRRAAATLPG